MSDIHTVLAAINTLDQHVKDQIIQHYTQNVLTDDDKQVLKAHVIPFIARVQTEVEEGEGILHSIHQ